MGNLKYCMFQNTASDFEDCVDEIRYGLPEGSEEKAAATRIYELSKKYITYYEKEIIANNHADSKHLKM